MAVNINVTQCYVVSEQSRAAKPSQDDCTIGACNSDAGVWVKFKDISLSATDQNILEDGGMLTDKHINFAQRLLKHAFPNINGLQLPLLQDKKHKEPTTNRVQILHLNNNHWVCAALEENHVNISDSA